MDGEALPEGLSERDTGLNDRFYWVLNNLKSAVITHLFEQTLLLDSKVDQILEELDRTGKATA